VRLPLLLASSQKSYPPPSFSFALFEGTGGHAVWCSGLIFWLLQLRTQNEAKQILPTPFEGQPIQPGRCFFCMWTHAREQNRTCGFRAQQQYGLQRTRQCLPFYSDSAGCLAPPTLYTRPDGVMDRRQSAGEGSEGRGGAEQVRLSETLYADDTGAYFLSRENLEKDRPLLFQLLEDFGLEAHSRPPQVRRRSRRRWWCF
jgi:hypothetical protein